MDSRVSIVIPVYNGSNYLGEAIESALGQTHKNLEVLVVNDGSSDDGATRRVAERYLGRVHYFEKPNGGVASALNFGIAKMTGDFFSWLSHDDLYLPDKIASQLRCFSESNCSRDVIVYGNFATFTSDSSRATEVDVPDANGRYFRHLLATSSAVHGCTLLIPKAAFRDQLFDETKPTTQDYDMWFRLARTFEFVKLGRTLVLARQHLEQDSVKKRRIVRAEKSAIYCKFLKELGPDDINPSVTPSPARAYMKMAADYAKHGLVGATLAAAGRSIACMSLHKVPRELMTIIALALICTLGIPLGLVRARVADAVRGASVAT